jgi:hypothetical protein
MRNLIIIALSGSIILSLSCCGSRIHCYDPSIDFGTEEKLVYKLDKYSKGSDFSNLIESKIDTAKAYNDYNGGNTYSLKSDFDWIITVMETGKIFKVGKIRYETYKAYMTFGDSHGSNTDCSNKAFYTLNGTEHKIEGNAWRYGSGPMAKPDFYITK